MDEWNKLIEKLRKVEALRDRGATDGERQAAEQVHEKLLRRLEELQSVEAPLEYRFTFDNPWSQRLFIALCRHFGLRPYRYKRQRLTTVMVRVPRSFVDETLWPMFEEYDDILTKHLESVAAQVIAEVFEESGDDLDELPS